MDVDAQFSETVSLNVLYVPNKILKIGSKIISTK